jgi:hypothetical protein
MFRRILPAVLGVGWYGLGVIAAHAVCSGITVRGVVAGLYAAPGLARVALLIAGMAMVPFAIGLLVFRRHEPRRHAALLGVAMGSAISLQLSVLAWLGSNSQLGSSFAFFGVVGCGFFLARLAGSSRPSEELSPHG